MNPTAKNILAVLGGILVGGSVNMALILLGPTIIPLPDGADFSTSEKLKESMSLLTPIHFVTPFLAHAIGTLVGACIAAKLAATRPITFAYVIGVFFLLGGISMVIQVGGPVWFIALDLIVAYLPMAFIGGHLASRR